MRIKAVLAAADRLGIALSPEEAALASETLSELGEPEAVCTPSHPQAAAASDELGAVVCGILERSRAAGPLSGKRLAVKDNIAVAGVPTAIGSGLPGFVGGQDATIVARAAAAGSVLTVKAQCEAFLLGANSFSSQPFPVRNPLDPRRSAGGSSSGSAALVAEGSCDMALGTDSAGSIRIPAAYCGIVGLKPGRGTVPHTGIAPLAPWLECAGPMARSVLEVAALFAAISGPDGVDPRQVWASAELPSDPHANLGKLRIGVLADAMAQCDAPLCGVLEAALEASGAELTAREWPHWQEAIALHTAIYLASEAATARGSEALLTSSAPPGWAAWNAALDPASLPRLKQFTLVAGEALLAEDPAVIARSMAVAEGLARSFDALLDDVDVLALPTTRTIAPLIPDAPTPDDVFGDTVLTAPFNLTGHPALSLPVGRQEGMSVGLQLVGRRGGEAHLLAYAGRIEAALGQFSSSHSETAS
jgi:amidase